jgi:hypothetical protein
MRKLFYIFPVLSLAISIGNLISWRLFESLTWLLATVLIALIFVPLAVKANEKDVPVYQVFGPILLIPIFFSIFAIMDFSRIEFLTGPQGVIYGVVTGVLTLVLVLLIAGPNQF